MSAEQRQRRKITAREGAEQLGVSTRTIRRLVAEPRTEYEARAEQRRAQVLALRAQGLKYREIADELGITVGSVGKALSDARRYAAKSAKATG